MKDLDLEEYIFYPLQDNLKTLPENTPNFQRHTTDHVFVRV